MTATARPVSARRHLRIDGGEKMRYGEQAARRVADRLSRPRRSVDAYKCPVCGWWHVGNSSPARTTRLPVPQPGRDEACAEGTGREAIPTSAAPSGPALQTNPAPGLTSPTPSDAAG